MTRTFYAMVSEYTFAAEDVDTDAQSAQDWLAEQDAHAAGTVSKQTPIGEHWLSTYRLRAPNAPAECASIDHRPDGSEYVILHTDRYQTAVLQRRFPALELDGAPSFAPVGVGA